MSLRFFLNLKVGKKLYLGFSIAILAALSIMFTAFQGFGDVQDKLEKSSRSVELMNLLTTARLNRVIFQYTGDTSYWSKNNEAMDGIMERVGELKMYQWSDKGNEIILNAEEKVSAYLDESKEFYATMNKRMSLGKELDSRVLYHASLQAEKLSGSGELTPDIALRLAQLAFQLNDMDSILQGYTLSPDKAVRQSLLERLDKSIASANALLPLLPANQHDWLQKGKEEMQKFVRLLEPYDIAWQQTHTNSVQILVKAKGVEDVLNELYKLQESIANNVVVKAKWTMEIVAIVSVLISILISVLITRSITRPLSETLAMAEQIARGDLTSTMESSRRDEAGLLMQAVSTMNRNLRTIIGDVRAGIDSVARASSEIAAGNIDLSSRTEQQAAAVVETASSMEELTSTVALNAENAQHASNLSRMATERASAGNQIAQRVIEMMKNVRTSSHKISEITSVINSIAFQTNILALNAAVEAARAGDQGKGFAVVAGEVRNLAQRSAHSAKEIESLINESATYVDEGFRLVEETGEAIAAIEVSVNQVRDIMNEIASATDEQNRGISQIAQAMTEMDTTTQQNAALVEESSVAAQSLEDQAERLEQAIAVFRVTRDATPDMPPIKLTPVVTPASGPHKGSDSNHWQRF